MERSRLQSGFGAGLVRAGVVVGLVVGASAVGVPWGWGQATAQDLTRLPRKGTALSDLLWEFEQHAPLHLLRHDAFEFVVAEGLVVNRGPRETEDKDWTMAKSNFAAWGETTIEVKRSVAIHGSLDTGTARSTFVERHGYFRDSSGHTVEPWWGQGTERYNRLRIGSRVILVGLRTPNASSGNFLYSPEFWPHFSVVFNVVIRANDGRVVVCVDAPWRAAGEGYWAGDRLVGRVSPSEAIPRREHCYSVSPDEAFDAIVQAIRERAQQ